jgi:hypothetical protein
MESLRRFTSRKIRFIASPRWKEAAGGELIEQKKIKILIQHNSAGFQIQMNGMAGKVRFPKIEDAKARAFEVIENGKAERYLQGVQRKKTEGGFVNVGSCSSRHQNLRRKTIGNVSLATS